MGLVDYSSSDDNDDDNGDDVKSGQKASANPVKEAPPPLPRAFHDLYAATVRTAPADDPSLHQGRHRAIPHVAGQWPSHLYIEWCPSAADHARLSRLLALLGDALGQGDFKAQGTSTFHSFLTSDLGAPLPLHISLSRPFVLPTAAKAGFLAGLTAAVASSGVAPFDVSLAGLDWFCSPDSARAFLVLRAVVQDGSACNAGTEAQTQTPVKNKPLVALLQRCNEQVTAAGQPALYATKGDGAHDAAADDNDDNDDDDGSRAASAFHVSVAWTLAADLAAWSDATQQAYEKWRQDDDDDDNADGHGNMTPLRIRVDSIKAKIGNVVTDIPLRKAGVSSAASAAAVQQRPSKRTRSDEVSKGPVDTSDTKQPRTKRSLFGI